MQRRPPNTHKQVKDGLILAASDPDLSSGAQGAAFSAALQQRGGPTCSPPPQIPHWPFWLVLLGRRAAPPSDPTEPIVATWWTTSSLQ